MSKQLARAIWRYLIFAAVAPSLLAALVARGQNEPPPPALQQPISVYNNWSSYDELSDNIPLTETLAMHELTLQRVAARLILFVENR